MERHLKKYSSAGSSGAILKDRPSSAGLKSFLSNAV
jgi:hypothetical protein